jgi:hypothetical protein
MNEETRQAIITELGTLMLANAELTTVNKILVDELDKAKENIKRLTVLIEQPPTETEGLTNAKTETGRA